MNMLILDAPKTIEQATRRHDDLAKALYNVLVGLKVINPEIPLDGAQLLMISESFEEHLNATSQEAG